MRRESWLVAIILMLSLGTSARGVAQWVHPGPAGGTVTSFASFGNDLYVSTRSGGVFHSRDSGIKWTPASTGLTYSSVGLLAAFGPIVLAATDSAGLFLSTDAGNHWSPANNGLPSKTHAFSFDTLGTIIFIGTDSGVYRSADGALQWSAANSGLVQTNVSTLRSNGTDIYILNGLEVFRSVDSGAVWVNVSSGLPGVPVNDLQASDLELFAATSLGIYTSSDHGRHWQGPDTAGLRIKGQLFAISTLLLSDTALLGVTTIGLFRSTDNGLSWTPVDTGNSPGSSAILNQMGTILFSGDNNGVLRSSDGGASWSRSNVGIYLYEMGYQTLEPLIYLGNNLIAKGDSLYVSTDLGVHWSRYDALNGYALNGVAIMGRYAFVATDSDGILRSSDYGATWTVLDGMTNVYPVKSLAVGAGVIYAGTDSGGVYRSLDSGTTWIQVDAPPVYSYAQQAAVAAAGDNAFVLFHGQGITDHLFYQSSDSGKTWKDLSEPGEYVWVTELWANKDFVFAGGSYALFRSPVDTSIWRGSGLSGYTPGYSFLATDSELFLGSSGVFISNDNGANWDSAGLANHGIGSFLIADDYLFAGTETGLWRRPLSDFPSGPPALVSSSVIHTNDIICYPNPTTGQLRIESSSNDFIITDLLGRTWLRSTNGAHDLDVSALPQGVYYIGDGHSRAKFVKE